MKKEKKKIKRGNWGKEKCIKREKQKLCKNQKWEKRNK